MLSLGHFLPLRRLKAAGIARKRKLPAAQRRQHAAKAHLAGSCVRFIARQKSVQGAVSRRHRQGDYRCSPSVALIAADKLLTLAVVHLGAAPISGSGTK